jgi:VanZ like family.
MLTLFIEIVQMLCRRITDIDDLLMNMVGTVIGYYLFIWIKKLFPKISRFSVDDESGWGGEPWFYFISAGLSSFFFQPFVAVWLLRTFLGSDIKIFV